MSSRKNNFAESDRKRAPSKRSGADEETVEEIMQPPARRIYRATPNRAAGLRKKENSAFLAFDAEEASAEGVSTTHRTGHQMTQAHDPRSGDPYMRKPREDNGSDLGVFGAKEVSSEAIMSTTHRETTPHQSFPFEETKEEVELITSSTRPHPFVTNEDGHHALPGAERVGGYSHHNARTADDNDTFLVGARDGDEALVAHTSVDVMARAQLVDDPIVAEKVGADRTEEYNEVKQQLNRKTRQMRIAIGIGLVLVGVIVAILSTLLIGRKSGPTSSPTLNPTTEPTLNPTTEPTLNSASLREAWIRLIQSRMPSTTFEDATSPQRRALDWMSQDSYTRRLNEDTRILQRFALAAIYYSTNGPTSWNAPNRDGWLLSSTECDWGEEPNDVMCTDNAMRYLRLYSSGLSGTLPRDVGLLSALTALSLGNNTLEGTIPSEVGLLSSLTLLYLWNNNLEGTIPSQIRFLSSLTALHLSTNSLVGTIPSEVGLLSSLKGLFLSQNNLDGTIPTQVWLLQHLTDLALFDNNLEGTIPSTIGLLSSLTLLSGRGNNLEGTIPTEIGLLASLIVLYLSSNFNLTGRLPTELEDLSNLDYLGLYFTNLSGSIPSNLCVTLERASIDCGEIDCDCCVGLPRNYTPC